MTVTSATQTPATTTTDSTQLGAARLADNFSTFLSLLTTQLKNQDPLSPLDSNEFTQQLTQMTGVEQQIATNDLLKKLVSNTSGGVATAVSLIGKQVRAVSDDANINAGQAKWSYALDAAATDLKLQVFDSKGKLVYAEAPTDRKIGEHAFTWNGKNLAGTQLPDGGPYTLKVTATDSAGKAITTTSYVDGVVSGVEQADGQTYITINGGRVTGDRVTGVTLPPSVPAPPQSTTPAATS